MSLDDDDAVTHGDDGPVSTLPNVQRRLIFDSGRGNGVTRQDTTSGPTNSVAFLDMPLAGVHSDMASLPVPTYHNPQVNATAVHNALYQLSLHDDSQAHRGTVVPASIQQDLVDALQASGTNQPGTTVYQAVRDMADAARRSGQPEDFLRWLRWLRGMQMGRFLFGSDDPAYADMRRLLARFRLGFGYSASAYYEDMWAGRGEVVYGDVASMLQDDHHDGWLTDNVLRACLTTYVVKNWLDRGRGDRTVEPFILDWNQYRMEADHPAPSFSAIPSTHRGDIYLMTYVDNPGHWFLTAIMKSSLQIFVLDSLNNQANIDLGVACAQLIIARLGLPGHWTVNSARSPQQIDTWNCGTYLLENAKALMTTGRPLTTRVTPRARVQWLTVLLEVIRLSRQSRNRGWVPYSQHTGFGLYQPSPPPTGTGGQNTPFDFTGTLPQVARGVGDVDMADA